MVNLEGSGTRRRGRWGDPSTCSRSRWAAWATTSRATSSPASASSAASETLWFARHATTPTTTPDGTPEVRDERDAAPDQPADGGHQFAKIASAVPRWCRPTSRRVSSTCSPSSPRARGQQVSTLSLVPPMSRHRPSRHRPDPRQGGPGDRPRRGHRAPAGPRPRSTRTPRSPAARSARLAPGTPPTSRTTSTRPAERRPPRVVAVTDQPVSPYAGARVTAVVVTFKRLDLLRGLLGERLAVSRSPGDRGAGRRQRVDRRHGEWLAGLADHPAGTGRPCRCSARTPRHQRRRGAGFHDGLSQTVERARTWSG